MFVHFDTRKLAEDHLIKSNFNLMSERPVWISNDKTVKASIHSVKDEIVCVFFAEIEHIGEQRAADWDTAHGIEN